MTTASQPTKALQREEVLQILTAHQQEFRKLGVKSLALFGSVARNEARFDSDVDLLIETDIEKLSAWGLADIRHQLQRLLNREIDLANPNLLKPRIREQILQEAIPILWSSQTQTTKPQDIVLVPRKDWKVYIDDIIKAATKIQHYVRGSTYDQFLADERTIDAVLHNLTIIGEAVSTQKLPQEIQAQHPQVPWGRMNEVRNIVVHQYDEVDLAIIWKIVQEGLPDLISQLEQLLARENIPQQALGPGESQQTAFASARTPQQLWQQYSEGISMPIQGKQLTAIAHRALQDNLAPEAITQMLLEAPYLKGLQQRQGPERAQELAGLAIRNAQIQIQRSQQSQPLPKREQESDFGPEL